MGFGFPCQIQMEAYYSSLHLTLYAYMVFGMFIFTNCDMYSYFQNMFIIYLEK